MIDSIVSPSSESIQFISTSFRPTPVKFRSPTSSPRPARHALTNSSLRGQQLCFSDKPIWWFLSLGISRGLIHAIIIHGIKQLWDVILLVGSSIYHRTRRDVGLLQCGPQVSPHIVVSIINRSYWSHKHAPTQISLGSPTL